MDYLHVYYMIRSILICTALAYSQGQTSVQYTLQSGDRTWLEARSQCESLGLTLAEVHNEDEQEQLHMTLDEGDAWIGGFLIYPYSRDASRNCDLVFSSGSGRSATIEQFKEEHFNNTCEKNHLFLCLTRTGLPDRYMYYRNYDNRFDDWSAARKKCLRDHGLVGSVQQYDESLLDHAMMPGNTQFFPIFSTWTWNNESANPISYTNWATDEPTEGAEKCLTISHINGTWMDRSCDRKMAFVCQERVSGSELHEVVFQVDYVKTDQSTQTPQEHKGGRKSKNTSLIVALCVACGTTFLAAIIFVIVIRWRYFGKKSNQNEEVKDDTYYSVIDPSAVDSASPSSQNTSSANEIVENENLPQTNDTTMNEYVESPVQTHSEGVESPVQEHSEYAVAHANSPSNQKVNHEGNEEAKKSDEVSDVTECALNGTVGVVMKDNDMYISKD